MPEDPARPSPSPEASPRDAPPGPCDLEPPELRSRWWSVAACLLFALALAPLALPVLRAGIDRVAPIYERPLGHGEPQGQLWRIAASADLNFVVWQISRNARTLLTHPSRIFDGEMCFPAEDSLAFGPSGITIGVLGIPAQLSTGDPVIAFNSVLFGLSLLSAAAMFLLVREWTGIPAAGLAAAMLYAFHWLKGSDLIHLYVRDNVWTVLALLFAYRLFTRRRWRDALGLGAAGVMHLGGSLYPLAAAALVAPVFAGWLLLRFGPRRLPLRQLLAVAVMIALAALLLLGPYLSLSAEGALGKSRYQVFPPLHLFFPGSPGFPGWSSLLLIAGAFALPAARSMGALANPRFALLAAALLVIASSVLPVLHGDEYVLLVERGAPLPAPFPNLYLLLERVLPGLDLGRGPGALVITAHMLLAVLAGLGAAAIVRSAPARARLTVAIAIVLLVTIETTRPAWLGFEPWHSIELAEVRPADEVLAFYTEVARAEPEGAILEIPGGFVRAHLVSRSVLNSAYHHRPTSQCYSPFAPAAVEHVKRLIHRMPDTAALVELRAIGFKSLVVHHDGSDPRSRQRRDRFDAFAAGAGLLERLTGNDAMSAYRILALEEP